MISMDPTGEDSVALIEASANAIAWTKIGASFRELHPANTNTEAANARPMEEGPTIWDPTTPKDVAHRTSR